MHNLLEYLTRARGLMISRPAISLPPAPAARSLSPPTRLPQLVYRSPTLYFAYMKEKEGEERDFTVSSSCYIEKEEK